MATVKPASTKQRRVRRNHWLQHKSLKLYLEEGVDQNTFGSTFPSRDEELNTLSYLVRKYPQEAMQHLNANEMFEESMSRRLYAYLQSKKEDSDCGKSTST